jgi:hypothetical protein
MIDFYILRQGEYPSNDRTQFMIKLGEIIGKSEKEVLTEIGDPNRVKRVLTQHTEALLKETMDKAFTGEYDDFLLESYRRFTENTEIKYDDERVNSIANRAKSAAKILSTGAPEEKGKRLAMLIRIVANSISSMEGYRAELIEENRNTFFYGDSYTIAISSNGNELAKFKLDQRGIVLVTDEYHCPLSQIFKGDRSDYPTMVFESANKILQSLLAK